MSSYVISLLTFFHLIVYCCCEPSCLLQLDRCQINDNYCDCPSDDGGGSDETLTPACSSTTNKASFSCGIAALGEVIPASRIWDGVCDCCDGSDEIGGPWEEQAHCNPHGCKDRLLQAQNQAMDMYWKAKNGLDQKHDMARLAETRIWQWQNEAAGGQNREERDVGGGGGGGQDGDSVNSLEKLLVMLKIYLIDEEAREKVEQARRAALCEEWSATEPDICLLHEDLPDLEIRRRTIEKAKAQAQDKKRGKRKKGRTKGINRTDVGKAAVLSLEWKDEENDRKIFLKEYIEDREQASQPGDGEQLATLQKTALLGPILNEPGGLRTGCVWALRFAGLGLTPILRGVIWELLINRLLWRWPLYLLNRFCGCNYDAEEGLTTIWRGFDYNRYPLLRAVVLHANRPEEERGLFGWAWWGFKIIWDSPVWLWRYYFPLRDVSYERAEAGILREGIAMCESAIEALRKTTKDSQVQAIDRLAQDFGPFNLLAVLHDKCWELEEREYKYKLCAFDIAKQGSVMLGRWARFGMIGEDGDGGGGGDGISSQPHQQVDSGGDSRERRRQTDYFTWHYTSGATCRGSKGNGIPRGARVKLVCGPENELISVQEPDTCQYVMELETPVACSDDVVKSAAQQLRFLGVDVETVTGAKVAAKGERASGRLPKDATAPKADGMRDYGGRGRAGGGRRNRAGSGSHDEF